MRENCQCTSETVEQNKEEYLRIMRMVDARIITAQAAHVLLQKIDKKKAIS